MLDFIRATETSGPEIEPGERRKNEGQTGNIEKMLIFTGDLLIQNVQTVYKIVLLVMNGLSDRTQQQIKYKI